MQQTRYLGWLIIILGFFSVTRLEAQEQTVYHLLNNKSFLGIKTDTAQINKQIRYANFIFDYKSDSTIFLCDEALAKSININYKNGAISALITLGAAYGNLGYYKKGIQCFKTALKYTQKEGYNDHTSIAILYSNLGILSCYSGNYDLAAYHFYKALEECEYYNATNYNKAITVYNNVPMNYMPHQIIENSFGTKVV